MVLLIVLLVLQRYQPDSLRTVAHSNFRMNVSVYPKTTELPD